MEFIREDCIYARQSVDRKDSISIESQIDFCKYELKGGSCRVFKDKGYSGKNTDRPEFQKLLGEIRKGKVRRVIVYKLDRISRSILDFATMMELFQEYDVEFVRICIAVNHISRIISICMPTLVHTNVVFQIAQPTFIIVDESLSIFTIRESYQIAVPCLVKADDSGKSSHLRHFQQGVVVIFGGADVQVHRRNPRVSKI